MRRQEAAAYLAASLAAGPSKSCDGRRKYGSEIAARVAARNLNRKPDAPARGRLVPRPCPFCDRWHTAPDLPARKLKRSPGPTQG